MELYLVVGPLCLAPVDVLGQLHVGLEVVDVIRHLFSCFFFSPFQPNFFTFLTNTLFFLMFIPLCFIMLTTNDKEHSTIGIVTGLPTPNISCRTATQSTGQPDP